MFHECARSAAEPSTTTTKNATKMTRNHDFHVSHGNSHCTNSFRLRLCETHTLCAKNPSDNTKCPRKSFGIFRNFGHHVLPPTHLAIPMLTPFARWLHKSRAKCRITLWDKLYESLGEEELLHDCARSAAEAPSCSPKYVTKSLETVMFAHMQNIAATCIF